MLQQIDKVHNYTDETYKYCNLSSFRLNMWNNPCYVIVRSLLSEEMFYASIGMRRTCIIAAPAANSSLLQKVEIKRNQK